MSNAYSDYTIRIYDNNQDFEEFKVVEQFCIKRVLYLAISPKEDVEANKDELNIYFIKVTRDSLGRSVLEVVESDDYDTVFDEFMVHYENDDFNSNDSKITDESIIHNNVSRDGVEFIKDESEDEAADCNTIFKVEDEDGEIHNYAIIDSFIYDDKKYHVCVEVFQDSEENYGMLVGEDDDGSPLIELSFIEVVDFESEDLEDLEFDKKWEFVQEEELYDELFDYYESELEQADDDEDEEDDDEENDDGYDGDDDDEEEDEDEDEE